MTRPHQEVDIARKLHTIEWLKSELLEGVSLFFKAMIGNNRQVITKALAAIILTCYFLGRRLGTALNRWTRRSGTTCQNTPVNTNWKTGTEIYPLV